MARPPRLDLPGVPQHVIQRGNNRAACFFGDVDRHFYLKCLAEAAARRGCAVHAYVLMSNHVHLLTTPTQPGAVAAMLQDVGRRYVRIINNVHGRTGTLWEGRYKSSLVDSERYLLNCQRYIELNPVRAGIVGDPMEYAWSSHPHYTGARPSKFITEHAVFLSLGENGAERRREYQSICAVPLGTSVLERIRAAINTDSALGTDAFLDHVEAELGRSVRPPKRGRPPKSVTGKLL